MSNQIKLLPVLESPEVVARLVTVLLPSYKDQDKANARVMAEIMEFNQALEQIKPDVLANVPKGEIFRVAVSSFGTGLSWAAEERNFYLTTRNKEVVVNGVKQWVPHLELALTADAEVTMRRNQNIITLLEGPHIILEGDTVEELDPANNVIVHKKKFPAQPNAKVLAVYCFVNTPAPEKKRLLKFFDQESFNRWAAFSRRQNTPKKQQDIVAGKDYANALYFSYNGGIDPGFAMAKCKKHAFSNLPKCKTIGDFRIPTAADETETIEANATLDTETGEFAPAAVVEPGTPEFNNAPPAQDATVVPQQPKDDLDF